MEGEDADGRFQPDEGRNGARYASARTGVKRLSFQLRRNLVLNEAHCHMVVVVAFAGKRADVCRRVQCAMWSHSFGRFPEFYAGYGELPG